MLVQHPESSRFARGKFHLAPAGARGDRPIHSRIQQNHRALRVDETRGSQCASPFILRQSTQLSTRFASLFWTLTWDNPGQRQTISTLTDRKSTRLNSSHL